jgi:hypothetical protein
MSEANNIKVIKDTLDKISSNSVLREDEALEIIESAMIFPEWLDFFSTRIIELANKRETVLFIKLECYSLMSQISVAGGLENYKRIIGLV